MEVWKHLCKSIWIEESRNFNKIGYFSVLSILSDLKSVSKDYNNTVEVYLQFSFLGKEITETCTISSSFSASFSLLPCNHACTIICFNWMQMTGWYIFSWFGLAQALDYLQSVSFPYWKLLLAFLTECTFSWSFHSNMLSEMIFLVPFNC